jgi:hypothetical protein
MSSQSRSAAVAYPEKVSEIGYFGTSTPKDTRKNVLKFALLAYKKLTFISNVHAEHSKLRWYEKCHLERDCDKVVN